MVRLILGTVLEVYLWILIARMILSWVETLRPGWTPRGPLLVICNGIYGLTDPPLRALGKVLKPVDLGGVRLSLASLALFVIVGLLQWLNARFMIF